jgi:Domain of unknown function (DUF3425)
MVTDSLQSVHPKGYSENSNAQQILYFPLTPDHQLLVLVANNVCRAILLNTSILDSLPKEVYSTATSCCDGHRTFQLPMETDFALPPCLKPTTLQHRVPHAAWIDLFPSPQLRDNLISAFERGGIDEDDLVGNLIGDIFDYMNEGDNLSQANTTREIGIVSWSDPWDIEGWELTVNFYTKYRHLLHNCRDVMQATNKWRLLRGEAELT